MEQPINTWPNYTPTRVELYKIKKTKKEFLLQLQQLLDSNELETPCDLSYERVITGKEADEIISKFNSHWEYYSDSYWFPLMGCEPNTVSFAGTIVPLVKDILRNEKEHWNRYEYPKL